MDVKILVAEDQPLCAAALAMAAGRASPRAQVKTVGLLDEAERELGTTRFDLIMLDLGLPDVDGLAGLLALRRLSRMTPIAIVSGRDDVETICRVRSLGARGFVSKAAPVEQAIDAIGALLRGERWFPESIAASATPPDDAGLVRQVGTLSPAQLRVLKAVANGGLIKQAAHQLGLTEPTIKSHLTAIYRKLNVTNRMQAVLAYRTVLK